MSAPSSASESLQTIGQFYTLANINALSSCLGLKSVLSPADISVDSRAILCHQAYQDGSHFPIGQEQGLHPEFIAVHGCGTPTFNKRVDTVTLLDASMKDVFDAVSHSFSSVAYLC